MSRKKQAALPVPTTTDGARELMAEYVDAERQIARARLVAEQAIDAVKAERDALIAIYAVPNAGRFAALKAWWEAGGKDLAGKRRSAELAGAVLGIRLTPPKLGLLAKLKDQAAIRWLLGRGLPQFIRTKEELDKPALIAALGRRTGCDATLADLLDLAFEVRQTDEFFIDCTIGEAPIAATNSSKE